MPGPMEGPLQTVTEAVRDPQLVASGAFVDVPIADGTAETRSPT